MPLYRRLLNVFLASPGDLESERRAAKEVVDEVAMTARELGVSLELLGWEDTLPGAQRPQEAINADLDGAELVVGLLWRRWGQPTGHANYSSGFEEEFERALQRRTRTGTPEIWLFFKEIELALRHDPGEQLQKVLLFRERCEAEKRIFFKQFDSLEGWTRVFRQHLHRYVVRLAGTPITEPIGEGFGGPIQTEVEPSVTTAVGRSTPSLLPLAGVVADLANGGDPQVHASADAGLHSARLYLLGLSLLAESGTSSDFANTHETNTLYRLRTKFDPLGLERNLLQRTCLADQVGVKPGWYWFPQGEEDQLALVAYYAIADGDPDVRRNTLAQLTAARVRHEKWSDVFFSTKTAESQPAQVEDAFWDYLEAVVAGSDLGRVEAMREVATSPERLNSVSLVARAQLEPGTVLAEVAASPTSPTARLLKELSTRMGAVDSGVLIAGFTSAHQALRELIADEMQRRGRLGDIREAARSDGSEAIRVLEYRERLRSAAVSGGERPPLPEELSYDTQRSLAVDRLRGMPIEQLRQITDWLNVENSAAYEVLATDHWDVMNEEIRADVSDGFERLRRTSLEHLAQSIGRQTEAVDKAAVTRLALEAMDRRLRDKIDPFSKRQFAVAALAGIERHGSQDDAELVRPFLKDVLTRDIAIRALSRIGDEQDVPTLLQLATEGYGKTKLESAKAALRLSGGGADVIQSLLQSKDTELVTLAVNALQQSHSDNLQPTLVALLNDGNNSTRVVAAKFLTAMLDIRQLVDTLDAYVKQPQYYYNVVAALDRALYCRLPQQLE